MPSLFTAPENLLFTLALGLVLALALIEALALVIGHSASQWLDGLLPDGLHISIDADLDAASLFDKFLGWLHFGKVPTLIIAIIFLTSFGLLGYGVQILARSLFGELLPGWMAVAAALPLCLPTTSAATGFIGRMLPRDETQVIKRSNLLGRVATIVIGEAKPGSPAQAKLRDEFRTTQYFMVEPNQPGEVFRAGEQVVIVAMVGTVFRAERFDPKLLTNEHVS